VPYVYSFSFRRPRRRWWPDLDPRGLRLIEVAEWRHDNSYDGRLEASDHCGACNHRGAEARYDGRSGEGCNNSSAKARRYDRSAQTCDHRGTETRHDRGSEEAGHDGRPEVGDKRGAQRHDGRPVRNGRKRLTSLDPRVK
jgi:hypothetical protein